MTKYLYLFLVSIILSTPPSYAQENVSEESKKVFIHLMGWFGENDISPQDGRHWEYGVVRKPQIGYYDSQSWATLTYQILLSWSCGVDGLVINVNGTYDSATAELIIPTLNMLYDIDNTNFNYQFSISYDDQGMDNLQRAQGKFEHLKNSILPAAGDKFITYDGEPVIFVYNYKYPEYLTDTDYNNVLNTVFQGDAPKVIWNEIEGPDVANSYYPWVKDDNWASDGSRWGKEYLDWYYPTLGNTSNLDFAMGGVWAGFDDRQATWSKDRWIDRQNGAIYDNTWEYVNAYESQYPSLLPLKWVYIETWNDWNEGTEIEPSEEFGYQYLDSTVKRINTFKGTSITRETNTFDAATKIYAAADLIEEGERDSLTYFPILQTAIQNFILDNPEEAIQFANKIINKESICELVSTDDFESGWGFWNDGGSDATKTKNANYAANGLYSLRLRDNTSTSVVTSDSFDASGNDNITVSFSYYPRSMDNSKEDFWLQVSKDGGTTFTTIASWVKGIDFENDNQYEEEVKIKGPFTSDMKLRFRCDASGNRDFIYLDDIVVEKCGIYVDVPCEDLTLNTENAELDWGIWNDGGSDASRISDAMYANSGSYSFMLRDNTKTSVITTDRIDATPYGSLKVDFSYYPKSMDNEQEDFWLQVSKDGGATFTTVKAWVKGTDFQNNLRYNESVFINGPFPANTKLRFRCDASGNRDFVYLDDITITGICEDMSDPVSDIVISNEETQENLSIQEESTPNDFTVFPNPTLGNVLIESPSGTKITGYRIYDSQYMPIQTMKSIVPASSLALDFSSLASGYYSIVLQTELGAITKRIHKK